MDIVFTNINKLDIPEQYHPKPSSKMLPEWYKETDSYKTGEKKPIDGTIPSTIKRCVPVFDSINSGYLIFSIMDVYVSLGETENGIPAQRFYPPDISNVFNPIEFHPTWQAPKHPLKNGFPYPKWNNPWAISTPKGYSTLFVQPFHRESVFTILPGIVDTDKYMSPINFPFVLNDINFEGIIPAGTPIAQVIPIKRDSWSMSFGNDDNVEKYKKHSFGIRSTFFDRYRSTDWTRKEYR